MRRHSQIFPQSQIQLNQQKLFFFVSYFLLFQYEINSSGNRIVVRPEEALIVIFVLILWVGAIGLFVHRWGKIRNCEPYTPKFEAEDDHHRGSCHDQSNLINKRMSMSSKLATPGTSIQMTGNPHSFTKGYNI